jgi:hypothetical protein
MAQKPRSDSTLDSLTSKQKEQLRDWLVEENLSYADAIERLRQDFNVRTSAGALSRFYATQCFSLRSSEAAEFAENVVSQVTSSGENYDKATLALIKQKAFERAYARGGNLDELATLAKIIGDSAKLELKRRDQELAERRIKLLEEKARQADTAKQISGDSALTPAEKEARLKAVFGIQ